MPLIIYKPTFQELWFKELMMSDEETMSYNHAYGGTIPFPEERRKEWYNRWIISCEGKRYYRYLKDDSGTFVGEISYHYDEKIGGYSADVVIYAKYRGRGFGRQALEMLCSVAKENGISTLYDEIAVDNPSVALFIKNGFSEERRTENTVILKKLL